MSVKTRAALARIVTGAHTPSARLILSPTVESYADAFGELTDLSFDRLSLETQQTDHHKAMQDRPEVPVGSPTIPTVYAVGAKTLAAGNVHDQAAMRAAVQDQIENDREVILAILPADSAATSQEEPDDTRDTLRLDADGKVIEVAVSDGNSALVDSAKDFMASAAIPVVESMEALREILAKRNSVQVSV